MDLSRVASTSARSQLPARDFRRQFEIQRALLGARDVRSILAVVRSKVDGDNGLGAMSFVHVATSLNRMGKVVWRADSGARDSERNLGDDPDFLALLRRAREFTYAGSKMSQAWANSVHALAKLRELRRLRVEPGDEVWDTWLDLIRRLPNLEGKLLSKHVTSVWWAHAVVGVVPDDATRQALGRELARLADDFEPRNVSNALWAIATLGIQPTHVEWTILNDIVARTFDESPDVPPSVDASSLRTSPTRSGRLQKSADFEEDARRALDAAVRRHARAMRSQEIANSVYALGVLGHSPGADAEAALAGAARVRAASRIPKRRVSPVAHPAIPLQRAVRPRRHGHAAQLADVGRRGRRGGETRAANVHAGRVHNPVGARYRAQTAGSRFVSRARAAIRAALQPPGDCGETEPFRRPVGVRETEHDAVRRHVERARVSRRGKDGGVRKTRRVHGALGVRRAGRYPRSRRVANNSKPPRFARWTNSFRTKSTTCCGAARYFARCAACRYPPFTRVCGRA